MFYESKSHTVDLCLETNGTKKSKSRMEKKIVFEWNLILRFVQPRFQTCTKGNLTLFSWGKLSFHFCHHRNFICQNFHLQWMKFFLLLIFTLRSRPRLQFLVWLWWRTKKFLYYFFCGEKKKSLSTPRLGTDNRSCFVLSTTVVRISTRPLFSFSPRAIERKCLTL